MSQQEETLLHAKTQTYFKGKRYGVLYYEPVSPWKHIITMQRIDKDGFYMQKFKPIRAFGFVKENPKSEASK